jgi:hypothetical protein
LSGRFVHQCISPCRQGRVHPHHPILHGRAELYFGPARANCFCLKVEQYQASDGTIWLPVLSTSRVVK